MTIGVSVPLPTGQRGAGLGNEVIPWGKAYLGAKVFGLRCLHPAWALNRRGYGRDFGSSFFGAAAVELARCSPGKLHVTADMALATGQDDYQRALESIRDRLAIDRVAPRVLLHEGMSGGFSGIARARSYLFHQLIRPSHVGRDLAEVSAGLDPERATVGVHIRTTDFADSIDGPGPGQFNTRLPVDWYEEVITGLFAALGERVQVLLVTDDPTSGYVETLRQLPGVVDVPPRRRPLLSDLFSLVFADALVCSVSSFSMLAAFLSERPYVWFGPHLYAVDGWRSIWGNETAQRGSRRPTERNRAWAEHDSPSESRGVAFDPGDDFPAEFLDYLEYASVVHRRSRDLVYYGVVPVRTPTGPLAGRTDGR
jgi:hypothetical protein